MAAASSGTLISSSGIASVLFFPLVTVSYIFVPVCRAVEITLTKALERGSPFELMVMPLRMFPFSAVRTPVVKSPITSFALPITMVIYTSALDRGATGVVDDGAHVFFVLLSVVFLLVCELLVLWAFNCLWNFIYTGVDRQRHCLYTVVIFVVKGVIFPPLDGGGTRMLLCAFHFPISI